jgi:hypothetical protein
MPTDLTLPPSTDPTTLYRYRDALYAEDLLIVGLVHLDLFSTLAAGPLHVAEYSVMLMHATQGRCYGVGEMEGWLRAAGFVDCQEVPGGAARGGVLARKA